MWPGEIGRRNVSILDPLPKWIQFCTTPCLNPTSLGRIVHDATQLLLPNTSHKDATECMKQFNCVLEVAGKNYQCRVNASAETRVGEKWESTAGSTFTPCVGARDERVLSNSRTILATLGERGCQRCSSIENLAIFLLLSIAYVLICKNCGLLCEKQSSYHKDS